MTDCDWLINWSIVWLTARITDHWIYWLADCWLTDWVIIDWLIWVINLLPAWLRNWLTDWLIDWQIVWLDTTLRFRTVVFFGPFERSKPFINIIFSTFIVPSFSRPKPGATRCFSRVLSDATCGFAKSTRLGCTRKTMLTTKMNSPSCGSEYGQDTSSGTSKITFLLSRHPELEKSLH